jgi:hypothetical protein
MIETLKAFFIKQGPPPTDQPVLAVGKAVFEDGEEEDYVAIIHYSHEDQCWRMGEDAVFHPVKWKLLD